MRSRNLMDISGHRSRSVFDRYNLTSQADLRDAARKMESARELSARAEFVLDRREDETIGSH